MAAKIFSLVMLLALSASAATATFAPHCSQPPTILPPVCAPYPPIGLPPVCAPFPPVGLPPVWANPILSILQSSPFFLQQQSALLPQLQQLVQPVISQVTLAKIAAYSQQQQFIPFNPLAAVNPAALQLQQLQQISPLAAVNPAALQLQQLLQFSPLAAVNPAALQLQQLLQFSPLAAVNPAAFLPQQQLLPFFPWAASSFQQPILGGALF